jgi:hypothetical protein
MSKTNLMTIDRAFNADLEARQEGKCLPTAVIKDLDSVGHRRIGGFSVPDPDLRAAKQNSYVQGIMSYASGRAAMLSTLEKAGITALAVLPKAAWDTICKRSELLTLSPDSEGHVYSSGAPFDNARKEANDTIQTFQAFQIAIGSVLCGVAFALAILSYNDIAYASIFSTLGHFTKFVLLSALMSIPGLILNLILEGAMGIGSKLVYRRIVVGRLLKSFNFIQSVFDRTDHGKYAFGVTLPQPPKDVAEVLLKAAKVAAENRYEMRTAAVMEAVHFTPSIADVYHKNDEVRSQEEEAARIAASRDPIVTLEKNGIVVVIAQFGDFPIEQKVLEEVTQKEYFRYS